jgi:hypothetical protein
MSGELGKPTGNVDLLKWAFEEYPDLNADFVTRVCSLYPNLEVPIDYHKKAVTLLADITDPVKFFSPEEFQSYKEKMNLDAFSGTLTEAFKVSGRSGFDSDWYRTLQKKLYLEVIQTALYTSNDSHDFILSRDDTYGKISNEIRKVDEGLGKLRRKEDLEKPY